MSNDKKNQVHPLNFESDWQYSDIKFKVEDKYVHANKLVLILWSPVFKAMFENNFREKNATEVLLPGKKFDDILELMCILHPPNKELTGNYNCSYILELHGKVTAHILGIFTFYWYSCKVLCRI